MTSYGDVTRRLTSVQVHDVKIDALRLTLDFLGILRFLTFLPNVPFLYHHSSPNYVTMIIILSKSGEKLLYSRCAKFERCRFSSDRTTTPQSSTRTEI